MQGCAESHWAIPPENLDSDDSKVLVTLDKIFFDKKRENYECVLIFLENKFECS